MICRESDLQNNVCVEFEINDKACFLVKHNEEVFAYVNRCPHLNINLNWQENAFLDADNALIQCSTHGALFTIETGECIYGPCQGQSLESLTVHLEDGTWKTAQA